MVSGILVCMDGSWDLDRLRQLVAENDLERGRIEYKRELGNGQKALEAITALANTFGGVVLIGVDEGQPPGDSRLNGVTAGERDRLVRLLLGPADPRHKALRSFLYLSATTTCMCTLLWWIRITLGGR
jgi:Putative DNA-binding domain